MTTRGKVRAFITAVSATISFRHNRNATRLYTSSGFSEPGALSGIARLT